MSNVYDREEVLSKIHSAGTGSGSSYVANRYVATTSKPSVSLSQPLLSQRPKQTTERVSFKFDPSDVSKRLENLTDADIASVREEGVNYYKANSVPVNNDGSHMSVSDRLNHDREITATYHNKNVVSFQFSEAVLTMGAKPFIPSHCIRTTNSTVWVEQVFSLDPAKDSKGTDVSYWQPADPQTAYGSQTNWAQAENLEPQEKYVGNIDNTYMFQVILRNVSNTAPYPVGVTFVETDSSGREIPKKKANFSYGKERFHAIVPPDCSGVDITCYVSGPEIDSAYGAKYTFLRANEDDITTAIEEARGAVFVPINSPVAEFLCEYARVFGWEHPVRPTDPIFADTFQFSRTQVNTATAELKAICENDIPVWDLKNLRVKFTQLSRGPASIINLAKRTLDLDTIYREISSTTDEIKAENNKRALVRNQAVVTCNIDFCFMFRDKPEDVKLPVDS